MAPFNIDPALDRELIESFKNWGEGMVDSLGWHRCPMCGCDVGYGTRWDGVNGEDHVEYCLAQCGYEEYV